MNLHTMQIKNMEIQCLWSQLQSAAGVLVLSTTKVTRLEDWVLSSQPAAMATTSTNLQTYSVSRGSEQDN